jgi:DegV family protein with EDD domain
MSIAVVVDSTAYLPAGFAERHGITVVPVQVVIGGQSHDDGEPQSAAMLAEALRRWEPVTTARPSPAAMAAAYQRLADAGAEAIVSVHLSAALSGTVESARLAAKEAPIPVRCVDSGSIGMAVGFAAAAAADAAVAGADLIDAVAAAERCAADASVFFVVDTLEYLRRGGRIGPAAAVLGGALAIKPLLHVAGGRIEPLEKVRTMSRALNRLEEVAVSAAKGRQVNLAVHHLADPQRAEVLVDRLATRLPQAGRPLLSEVGAVVGAHVGPGMLAVVVAPRQ